MSYLQAVFWGVMRGLTEIFPVSSSAHQAFFEKIFGMPDAPAQHPLFFALLDFGMFFVLAFAYRHEAAALLRALHSPGRGADRPARQAAASAQRLLLLVIFGLLPLVLEFVLVPWAGALAGKALVWALLLVITGFALFVADYFSTGTKDENQTGLTDALLIGMSQAIAVLPGFSRTGLTLFTGYARGLQPEFALRYSFFLVMPYWLGSGVIRLVRAIQSGISGALVPVYLVGTAACILAGLAVVRLLQLFVMRRKLGYFSFYCWGAAVFSLFLFLIT